MNPWHPAAAGGLSRRELLAKGTLGVGTLALASLLECDRLLAEPLPPDLAKRKFDLSPKPAHHAPRAQAMISLYMQGGPSHVDLFDPKPLLTQLDGKQFPGEIQYDNAAQASSKVLGSPWKFDRHGQSGAALSELLPHLAEVVDDLAIVRSMRTGVNNHGQSIDALNGGRPVSGRPALGSWLTYGLGAENQNLPAFVVLVDQAAPVLGSKNWANGWLPSLYQGTVIRQREPRILNLDPPPEIRGAVQERTLGLLGQMNRRHLEERPGELDLEARIASYELAARMQTSAKEALDIGSETTATLAMYGIDQEATRDYGLRCLIARRLIERGVRFVQIFTTTQAWDHHGAIVRALPAMCQKTDKPAAALVKDLKQRGLLESTVVHWGGEMGRLPVIQNDAGPENVGRDHNTYGFTSWFAGGGFRPGIVYGATDEFGHHAVENVVMHSDYHATLLHLFGLDYRRLTYKRNATEQSLVDNQPCRIVQELLA